MRSQYLLPTLLLVSCATELGSPTGDVRLTEVRATHEREPSAGGGRSDDAPSAAPEAPAKAAVPTARPPATAVLGYESAPAPSGAGATATARTEPVDELSMDSAAGLRHGAKKAAPPAEALGDRLKPSPEDLRAALDGAEADSPAVRAPPPAPRRAPSSPGVKAGAADDNLAFAAYLRFLRDHRDITPYALDLSQRVVVRVRDKQGRPVHDARVALKDKHGIFEARRTYPDGRALLFVSEQARAREQGVQVEVSYQGVQQTAFLNASRKHTLEIRLDTKRSQPKQVPLDIAFVLDTTGSMGDELARLKETLEVINFQIRNLSPRPDVRFGMVLYRDVGDDYRVRSIPFTRDVQAFAQALSKVQAGGGDDYPEDVQEGLRVAMQDLKWRESGVRLAFLIGDAPPHTDYEQSYTYVSAMKDAARRGIKIATIGASGLTTEGEVVWRQIAQYTMAPFVFLSYGEKGDSEGAPSSVSHHVGSNWVAENLDAIIVRMVKVEMAHLSPRGAPQRQDYFSASRSMRLPADDVLEDLFTQSVRQLLDYSVQRISPRTPTVILPLSGQATKAGHAKLERRLHLGLARTPAFQLIERKAAPKLLKTLAQQMSERFDEGQAIELGKMVPAKLAVLGHVEASKDGPYEMLVKLVRLETGEVLSLSLLKIDRSLLM